MLVGNKFPLLIALKSQKCHFEHFTKGSLFTTFSNHAISVTGYINLLYIVYIEPISFWDFL